jgi:hypothetical protein
LNGGIEKGPYKLNDLFAILLMFGKFQYAFIADISEMFVRIRLTEADKNTTDSGGMKTSGSGTEFCLGIGQAQTLVKKVIATHALKRKYSYPEAS